MLLRNHSVEVAAVMMERSTQTNEPARCATLLPVLAALPQPIALLEVGASAGLCLMPDRYGYTYGDYRVAPTSAGRFAPPVFLCRASDNTPPPENMPVVVWRVGLDQNPVEVNDEDQVAWLETLLWPEEVDRLANLRAALAIAKEHRLSSSVVTCGQTCQHWRRKRPTMQRWSYSTPLCSPIWNDLTDCASENLCVEYPLHGFPTRLRRLFPMS